MIISKKNTLLCLMVLAVVSLEIGCGPQGHKARQRIGSALPADKAAEKAADTFRRVVSLKEIPEEIPEFQTFRGAHKLSDLLAVSQMAPSKKEAHRLLSQGAVTVDGKRMTEKDVLDVQVPVLIQVGKRRFVRIVPT